MSVSVVPVNLSLTVVALQSKLTAPSAVVSVLPIQFVRASEAVIVSALQTAAPSSKKAAKMVIRFIVTNLRILAVERKKGDLKVT